MKSPSLGWFFFKTTDFVSTGFGSWILNTGQKPLFWEFWNPNKTLAAPLNLRCSSSCTSPLVPPKRFPATAVLEAAVITPPEEQELASRAQIFLASNKGLFLWVCAVFQLLLMRSELETCWVFLWLFCPQWVQCIIIACVWDFSLHLGKTPCFLIVPLELENSCLVSKSSWKQGGRKKWKLSTFSWKQQEWEP